jgi:hypothetical protein
MTKTNKQAIYVKRRSGCVCPDCGEIAKVGRTCPPWDGLRIRYQYCDCGWKGKSFEELHKQG